MENLRKIIPINFYDWSEERQIDWLYYRMAHMNKDRWERHNLWEEYSCSASCMNEIRFAYIITGRLYDANNMTVQDIFRHNPEEAESVDRVVKTLR